MRSRLAIRLHALLEHYFPERRVFLRSDKDTRFIRLRPHVQVIALGGSAMLVAWAIIATAIVLMDSIGSGNFREQAKRDRQIYETRLNHLASERDTRAEEALAAQERFNSSLEQISRMQSQLLASETRRRELETGIEVIQTTLRRTMKDRDAARAAENELRLALTETPGNGMLDGSDDATEGAVNMLSTVLAETAAERDQIMADARDALEQADEMAFEIRLMQDQNDQIFRQLEEAMAVSVKPLDKMFRSAGLNTDSIINQVRRGYSGQGGPLTPLSFSTKGEAPSPDAMRANRILNQMDRLNLYRIAAEKAPFAIPVKNAYRFTSGFGYRRDPKTGGRRLHQGVDFAGPVGTPLYATADGVVTHSGWSSGYGRLVKIQHEFGIETRYAHMSKINVKSGQRVSRGDRIGDMGASGRVTGPHLHYEVRIGGKAVNPMTYIKAANDVF
ncbi:peptidoglycan DD-metalloendopeptidase family protein [Aquicoccus porphyridii]|uniref:Peptidoglycan DD-metalloendopeptidase family protein n=1 Tax=Aquicoccus porphyridii TaxID=1852029 RepID=A0A5A9ZTX8_9RHOB|nr:M23 family metallopeptidase [Aquicoccus porphyridii]KAA0920667.1 peptidoglycan DD-metalloendopeptidase family protein [Aquicoccus porphyridii]RAI56891.1 M23 family peptidase [Rhodobacteraceae bacterium AsT-22]